MVQHKTIPAGIHNLIQIVGREQELEVARSVIRAPHGYKGLLIAGSTGTGKTRIAQEIATRFHGNGTFFITPQNWKNYETIQALKRHLDSSKRGDALVVLDDAHQLPHSIPSELFSRIRAYGVPSIFVVNVDETPHDEITTLWKNRQLERIDVLPLTATAGRRLASLMADFNLNVSDAARLAKLAAGNPLLLREIVTTLKNRSALAGHDGRLPDEIPTPPGLRDLIIGRVRGLDAIQNKALETISLLSLARLKHLEQLFSLEVLLELEDRGLISVRVEEVSRVHVASPLIAHVIRSHLNSLRGVSLLRDWCSVVSWDELQPDERLSLAEWSTSTIDTPPRSWLLEASNISLATHDIPGAMQMASKAWEFYRSPSTALSLADALVAGGDFAALEVLADEAKQAYGAQLGDLLFVHRIHSLTLRGLHGEALTAIGAMASSPLKALLRGSLALQCGNFKQALLFCNELDIADSSLHRLESKIVTVSALCHLGQPLNGLEIFDKWCHDFDYVDKVLSMEGVDEARALCLQQDGRLAEAEALLTHERLRTAQFHNPRADLRRSVALSLIHLEQGRIRKALELLVMAPEDGAAVHLSDLGAALYAVALTLLPIRERISFPDPVFNVPTGRYMAYQAIASARLSTEKGDSSAALETLETALAVSADEEHFGDVALIVHELARLGYAARTSQYWEVPLQGVLIQARLWYAQAVATGELTLLRRAARVFSDCGALMYAAESFAELCRIHQEAGRGRSATAASVEARRLLQSCGEIETPPLRFLTRAVELSDRERTVASLAAQNLSDREISQLLMISHRTVSNTLYRVYQKLGLRGRRELGSIFSVTLSGSR
ncbi:LuxR C-terminal-related transcriptional regulator [Streptomyces sp. NPDC002306]